MSDPGKPLYLIGVVADMLKVHPQTLRLYERKGLVRPSRTVGRTRMYSEDDVDDIRRILRLTGVEIILKMRRHMLTMQQELEARGGYARQPGGSGPEDPEQAALVPVADRRLRKLDVF
jgi:MerR family transcriptional regulator, heat shock protein HspR